MATTASAGSRRVLIVVQNLPVPFDRRVWLEATTLARAGWSVSVICPKAVQFPRSFEELEDVHIYRYSLPFEARGPLGFVAEFAWCFLRTAMKTARVAARGRGFDVLHVCNPPETYWPLGWICQRFRKRFVFDHHDLSPEMYAVKFGDRSRLTLASLRFLERMTFRVADIVITTNESHRDIAIRRGGKAPQDVFVVRSGPDLLRLRRTEPDLSWRHGRANLLVYLGEICEQDGVDHLVRALQILRDELGRKDVSCVFVGGGPHQPTVKEYAHTIGVSEMCTFTGRVSDEDLSVILSSADIGVDPDPKNDWSDKSTMNKVMEYMFFGLPVVAYDLTETRVSADGAAVYAEPNSERSLAAEINSLLDDPERRERMGTVGHARVQTALAWEYSAPILLEAYDQLSATALRPHHVWGRDAMGIIEKTATQPEELRVGDLVEVRSEAEILATLDEHGMLESLPFMSEMLPLCGQRFRVDKLAHKACDTIDWTGLHRMKDAVHLADVRCDGSGHGGCQAGCLIYWKTSWLRKVEARSPSLTAGVTAPAPEWSPPGEPSPSARARLLAAGRRENVPGGRELFVCQVTELMRAAPEVISPYDLRQYVDDVRSGNAGLLKVLRAVLVGLFNSYQKLSRRLLPAFLRIRGGSRYPFVIGKLTSTPLATLGLSPGDLVRVRTKDQIVATLNANNKNRGLSFDVEMLKYCGRTARVHRRVYEIIDEKTGEMIRMKFPCIILEDMTCAGEFHRCCPRAVHAYWREAWLERLAPT